MKDKSLSQLIKTLDGLVSKYVRLSAADENGYCKCVCCDIRMHWKLMDCAHFVSRSHMATRFYLPNLGPAAKCCNQFDPVGHLLRWENTMPYEQKNDLLTRGSSLAKFTAVFLVCLSVMALESILKAIL